MINFIDDEAVFWEKINNLQLIAKGKYLPDQIFHNTETLHTLFIPDLFYKFPVFLDKLFFSTYKDNRNAFYAVSISPEEINNSSIRRETNNHLPMIEITYPFIYQDFDEELEGSETVDSQVIADILCGNTGDFSHVWAFDDTGDWLICNQRQDITLFSTSNKILMDAILSSLDETTLWMPKGYDLDPENLPPYITKIEFDEGCINEESKFFTLELLKNYQWKDF